VTLRLSKTFRNHSGELLSQSDGVHIYCRRSGEKEFALLATDTRSPYTDERPNAPGNSAETREYMAFYFIDDKEVGQPSDIVTLTV
jgi:hypothetical protein